MKKLFTIITASFFIFNIAQANMPDNTSSFHLDEAEMQAYIESLGMSTTVDEEELAKNIPAVNVYVDENSNAITIQFENPNSFNYKAALYNMDGESIDNKHFIRDESITLKKYHTAKADYIYNIEGEDGHIYTGLVTF